MMKLNIGANIGLINVGTEINTNSITQIIGEIKESNVFDGIKKEDFDISIGF